MQIDVDKIRELRKDAERAINDEINKQVEKFTNETGLRVYGVSVRFADCWLRGRELRYATDTEISVEIPR